MKRTLLLLSSALLSTILAGCSREQEPQKKPITPVQPAASNDNYTPDGIRIRDAKLGEWTHDWDAALALARAEKRPILAMFTASDWNNWHAYFAARVLYTEDWKAWAAAHPLVLAWLNIPNDETLVPKGAIARNRNLVRQYNATDFPAVLLLNPATRQSYERYHVTSETSAPEFISWVQRTIMDNQPGGIKHYLSNDDVTILEMLRAECEPHKKAYNDALRADNQELDALHARKAETDEIAAWTQRSDARLAELRAPIRAFQTQMDVYYARAFESCFPPPKASTPEAPSSDAP